MYTKIKLQIKEAMKNKDVNKRDVLKMVVDKSKSTVKEKTPNSSSDNIDDGVVIQAIKRELKQLYQTKESLKNRTNSELYIETLEKIDILESLLPRMMSEDEIRKEVEKILSIGNYPNFGMKMKAVMPVLKDKADSKLIKKVVESF